MSAFRVVFVVWGRWAQEKEFHTFSVVVDGVVADRLLVGFAIALTRPPARLRSSTHEDAAEHHRQHGALDSFAVEDRGVVVVDEPVIVWTPGPLPKRDLAEAYVDANLLSGRARWMDRYFA